MLLILEFMRAELTRARSACLQPARLDCTGVAYAGLRARLKYCRERRCVRSRACASITASIDHVDESASWVFLGESCWDFVDVEEWRENWFMIDLIDRFYTYSIKRMRFNPVAFLESLSTQSYLCIVKKFREFQKNMTQSLSMISRLNITLQISLER